MNDIEEWKSAPIEHLSNYQISNKGNVRVWSNSKQCYRVLHGFRLNQNNTYKTLTVIVDGRKHSYQLHRIVAIAFIPIPIDLSKTDAFNFKDGYPYLINHKDGNKANNSVDNLEWTNHLGNNKHATSSGLRSSTVKILCYDHLLKEEKLFNTTSDLAVFLNLPLSNNNAYRNIMSLHKELPYKGRYTFRAFNHDTISDYKILTKREVMVKDYVKNEISIHKSIAAASMYTGVKVQSIDARLTINQKTPNMKMLAGYDFLEMSYVDEKTPAKWKVFTKEEAIESRERYFSIALSGKRNHARDKIVVVTDCQTGLSTRFFSLKEACLCYKLHAKYISAKMMRAKARGRQVIVNNLRFDYEAK